MDPVALANEIDGRIRSMHGANTDAIRRVRVEYSNRLRRESPEDVLALGLALVPRQRWVGYELIYHHPYGLSVVGAGEVEQLGQGINSWDTVDTFGRYVSGPAWQQRRVPDELIRTWTASNDRWWRRAALVSTVPLNLRAAGGTGDTARTLDICERLVADTDDMVVKAMSWVLRALSIHDPDAVVDFLRRHAGEVAARVRREVNNKLGTGLKNPKNRV